MEKKSLDVNNTSRASVLQIIREMANDNLHSHGKYLLMLSMCQGTLLGSMEIYC